MERFLKVLLIHALRLLVDQHRLINSYWAFPLSLVVFVGRTGRHPVLLVDLDFLQVLIQLLITVRAIAYFFRLVIVVKNLLR